MDVSQDGIILLITLGALLLLVAVLATRTFLSRGKHQSPPSNTGGTSKALGGPMPNKTPKYKQRAALVAALSSAGIDGSSAADVLDAYDTANPSAFTDVSTLSDAEFRKKTVEFTRRHLRRFPKTQSALALSLRGLAKGETTSYVK